MLADYFQKKHSLGGCIITRTTVAETGEHIVLLPGGGLYRLVTARERVRGNCGLDLRGSTATSGAADDGGA